MALPPSTEPRKPLGVLERLSDCFGSDHHLRLFLDSLADALQQGGPVHVQADAIPGSGRVLKAPLILSGRRPW